MNKKKIGNNKKTNIVSKETYPNNDPRNECYIREIKRPSIKYHLCLIYVLGLLLLIFITLLIGNLLVFPIWLKTITTVLVSIIYFLISSHYLIITLIHIYQRFAPAKIRGRCMYEPSCSEYMIQSIQKYGIYNGIQRGIRRLKRCKPYLGGFDPP